MRYLCTNETPRGVDMELLMRGKGSQLAADCFLTFGAYYMIPIKRGFHI